MACPPGAANHLEYDRARQHHSDLGRVRPLLTLLLRNALDPGALGGHIGAVASLDAGYPVIEVWKDGESIAPADREEIFSPHERSGTYLCRQIAEAHAGSIGAVAGRRRNAVHSENPNVRRLRSILAQLTEIDP